MAVTEDAATVLEQFIHDVANLPAEIAHLYEEANAKQDLINECNTLIVQRDGALQKQVWAHGSLAPHPKEEVLCKSVREAYDRAQILQEEKIALVTKACSLLERYVKRLDIKIRDLQSEGLFPVDNNMPTLLRQSNGNLVAVQNAAPAATTTISTALQPSSGNAGTRFHPSSSSRAAAAAAAAAAGGTGGPGSISAAIASAIRGSGNANTTSGASTPGLPDAKRRRLNASLAASLQSSAPVTGQTRHSSLGPGTPKASIQGTTSRAGSVGPGGTVRPSLKKAATMPRKIPGAVTPGGAGIVQKKVRIGSSLAINGPSGTLPDMPSVDGGDTLPLHHPKIKHASSGPLKLKKKKDKKRGLLPASSSTSTRNSPAAKAESTPDPDSKKKKDIKAEDDDVDAMDVDDKQKKRTASASSSSESSGEESSSEGADSSEEEEDNEEEDGVDDTKYCYCQDVSHGDMIACDNANCAIQWFHLACAGITEVPQGEWLCNECRRLPKDKIRTNT